MRKKSLQNFAKEQSSAKASTKRNFLRTRFGITTLGVLVTLGIVLRVANLGNVSSSSPDELIYTLQAKYLLQGRQAALKSLIAEYQRDPVVRRFPVPTRLGYLLPLATAMRLTGETDERVGRYLSCAFSVGSLALVALIGIRFFPSCATLFALLFFAVSPMELAISRRAWTDALLEFLCLLLVYATAEITHDSKRRIWYWLFVVIGSFGILVKETGLIGYGLCAMWVLWVLLVKRRDWTRGMILISGGLLGLAITIVWLALSVGGIAVLARIVASIPSSNAMNQYAIEYQSGSGFLLLRSLAVISPVGAIFALTGFSVLFLSHRRVNFLHLAGTDADWSVIRWLALFVLAYLAWPMLLPGCLNLRYISVLFGIYYLIAGIGFWYFFSLLRNRLTGITWKLSAGLAMAALCVAGITDYARFQRLFVRDALQDLSVKMVLDPENPKNAIHTVASPSPLLETNARDAQTETLAGNALLRQGKFGEAIAQYEIVLKIAPDFVSALNNFAWLLSTCPDASLRNGARALSLAEKADQLASKKSPVILRTLAAAYAENGRFADAIETVQRASGLARAQENFILVTNLQKDLALYRRHLPLHPVGTTNARQ